MPLGLRIQKLKSWRIEDRIVEVLGVGEHQVDVVIEEAIREHELSAAVPSQGDLYDGYGEEQRRPIQADAAKASVIGRLHTFLEAHGGHDDLGLRLKGEQLARGVRFLHLVQEGRYDLVVGNPPYLGSGKLREPKAFKRLYASASADYFGAFFQRGLELSRRGGQVGMITLSNWMFLKVFSQLRTDLLTNALSRLADFGKAAFSTGGTLISTSATIFRASLPSTSSIALRSFEDYEPRRDEFQPLRTESALLAQVGRHEFDPAALKVVPEWPLVYWWTPAFLAQYASADKLGDLYESRKGTWTSDNARFLRRPHEVVEHDFHRLSLTAVDSRERKWWA